MMKNTILALLLFVWITGCAAKKEEPGQINLKPFKEGISELAHSVHESILREVKEGRLTSVLDIYVANSREQTTDQRIAFSDYLEDALITDMRKIPSGKAASITYSVAKEENKSFTQEEAIQNTNRSGGNTLLTGTYMQLDEKSVQINLKLIDTKSRFVAASSSVTIHTESIPKEILKTFPLEVNRDFEALRNNLQKTSLGTLSALVSTHWNRQFTESQKEVLRSQVTKVIRQNIRSLTQEIKSIEQLNDRKKELETFESRSFKVELLGYDYALTYTEKEQIEQVRNKVKKYQKAVDSGVTVILAFVAKSSENKPLGFKCSAWFDHDLVIYFGTDKFHYKDGKCEEIKNQQVMIWPRTLKVKATAYNLRAVEEGMWDTVVNGFSKVSQDQLIQLFNTGWLDIPIDHAEYHLRLIEESYAKRKKRNLKQIF